MAKNPKHKIRNSKQIQNSKLKLPKQPARKLYFENLNFGNLILFRISIF